MKILTKVPQYYYGHWPQKRTASVFQWPNGCYSIFVRKPTKTWGRFAQGMLMGTYYDIKLANKAAKLWRNL